MYPPSVLALISSTTYPELPSIPDLEALHSTLTAQITAVTNRIAASSAHQDADTEKKLRKEKRRREKLEEEAAAERVALEANEKAGMRMEAIERNRLKEQRRNSPQIKKERTGRRFVDVR